MARTPPPTIALPSCCWRTSTAGHSSRSWARTAPAPGAARPCPEQRASRTCARDARAVGARARIDRPRCADLPAVLGAGALSETSLGDLDEALKLAEAPDLLKRTIEGERVREMTFLASILGPDWPDGELRSASAKRRPFWERPRLLRHAGDYLAATAEMIHAAGEPWPQVLDAMPATFPSPRLLPTEISVPWSSLMESRPSA